MDHDTIVQSIDEEIDILQRLRALLTDDTAPLKRGFARSESAKRRNVSEESRARMAAAQRARRKREKASSSG